MVNKYTGNDFMNIEKANVDFKKALNIDIKNNIDNEIWDNMVDIVNIRNMTVHNNGRIDNHFRSTITYQRMNDRVDDSLFRIEDTDITKYYKSLMVFIVQISNVFLKEYYSNRNKIISNYYFNKNMEKLVNKIDS